MLNMLNMLNRHQKCSLGTPMVAALVINVALFDAPFPLENLKKCQPVLFEMPLDCPAEH